MSAEVDDALHLFLVLFGGFLTNFVEELIVNRDLNFTALC